MSADAYVDTSPGFGVLSLLVPTGGVHASDRSHGRVGQSPRVPNDGVLASAECSAAMESGSRPEDSRPEAAQDLEASTIHTAEAPAVSLNLRILKHRELALGRDHPVTLQTLADLVLPGRAGCA